MQCGGTEITKPRTATMFNLVETVGSLESISKSIPHHLSSILFYIVMKCSNIALTEHFLGLYLEIMSGKLSSPTLESIGAACGVSHITASRALRGLPNVKPATAQRIREYAKSIGYRHISEATRSRSALPVIFPYEKRHLDVDYPIQLFWDYVEGAVQASVGTAQGVEVMSFDYREELSFFQTLVEEKRIAGVLNSRLMPETVAYLLSKKIPLVSRFQGIGGHPEGRGAAVFPDDIQGYLKAWQRLLGMGHRQFCYLWHSASISRLNACRAARELLDDRPEMTFLNVELGHSPDVDGLARLLPERFGKITSGRWPSLLFCSNDEVANATVAALSRIDISVPEQVSVFGFDDSPAARFCSPRITTLSNPRRKMGAAMFHLICDIIEGRPNSRNRVEVYPMTLVERESVRAV